MYIFLYVFLSMEKGIWQLQTNDTVIITIYALAHGALTNLKKNVTTIIVTKSGLRSRNFLIQLYLCNYSTLVRIIV